MYKLLFACSANTPSTPDMKTIAQDALAISDLLVDAVYQGGRKGNAGDDPLPRLIRVDSQGGFRYRGKVKGKLDLLVLTTSMNDSDWPDELDSETGIFTYFGDNKKPGRDLVVGQFEICFL